MDVTCDILTFAIMAGMMKWVPVISAMLLGILIGWMAHGMSGAAAETESRRGATLPERKRPSMTAHAMEVRQPSFAEPAGADRTRQFQRWVDGMTEANWRSYLDAALSQEARDHGFLHHMSLESMMLLRKLGEMGGEEPIKLLVDATFTPAAAEVMEGWATKDPEAAMRWVEGNKYSPYFGENNEVLAKAVGAMIESDPDRVWKTFGQIREPLAREFVRRKGLEGMDELLWRYWMEPAGDYMHDRLLQDKFGDWEGQSDKYRNQELHSQGSSSFNERMKLRAARYDEYLSRNPNPMVREYIEVQLKHIRPEK